MATHDPLIADHRNFYKADDQIEGAGHPTAAPDYADAMFNLALLLQRKGAPTVRLVAGGAIQQPARKNAWLRGVLIAHLIAARNSSKPKTIAE